METLMDGPIYFYQLVYISILSTACCSLPERGPPRNLQMESRNFQHILSWQAKSDPTVPTYYRVLYTDRRNWKTAKQCSDITQLSCNLTDDFKEFSTQYSALVQSFIGTEVFNSSVLHFVPFTDTFLGPPEVNISACLNCINVTIKLPTSHFKKNEKLLSLIDIYEELDYDITVKTLDGEHKRPREKTTEEIFNTVIEELYPNRNYCVSVMITASLNKHSIPSAWKCITAKTVAQQDYHTVAIAGAVCFSLMLAGALKCMHAGGYILQKKSLPHTLVSIRTLADAPWIFKSEEIASVEIIYKEVKKKANESSSGVSDEDDSDSDVISNHDYTRREIISRVPHSSDTPNIFVQYSTGSMCDDSSSQANENPDADPEDFEEHEMNIEDDKDASISGIVPKPQNARIISVNLHSILQWDAPRFHEGNISYTVQSQSINFPGHTYENVSTNLRLTECDVSSLSAYGDYILQVRAESENNHSDWVTVRFKPMDDTVIGPPDVKVKSESGSLHVDFIGPFAEHGHDKWPLKQYYGSWNYRILYWKKGSNTEVTHIDTKYNSEILSQLEPWTIYCIQVQAVIPEWNKTGELSGELCEQTTHNGVTPAWIIVTVLIGSMLVIVISVPVCFFSFLYLYRLTRRVFCPSYVFPQHLKEFLSKSPSGSQFFPPLPQEEHLFYDKLTVISEESKNQSDETANEASKTTEHLQDSEQEDSDSGIVPALEKA